MGSYRIYVGNLPPTITADELKSKFATFCSRVDNDGLEIKNKNESTFAYLNLYDDNERSHDGPLKFEQLPQNIQKCIAIMNNTKWKGNLIKVQLAKESFLTKLRKEQQSQNCANQNTNNFESGKPFSVGKEDYVRPDFHHDERSSKLLALAGMVPIQSPAKTFRRSEPKPPAVYDFEIVKSSPMGLINKKDNTNRKFDIPSSDSDSDLEQVKEGFIPKFRGILQSLPETANETEKEDKQGLPAPLITPIVDPAVKGIKFNPLKRQKSNDLRLKSMDNKFMNDKRQADAIKTSLKQLDRLPQSEELVVSSNIKSKRRASQQSQAMQLFNDEEEEEDGGPNFQIKKQFEGESGQHLLELKSKWNFDDRFRIDERFNNEDVTENADGDETTILQKEKEGAFNILNQMFGHDVKAKTPKGKSAQGQSSDFVIIPRYDPDSEEQQHQYENQATESGKGRKDKKVSVSPITDNNKKSDLPTTDAGPPKKVEYKVASNLKSLFSGEKSAEQSGDNQGGHFSLLSAFGSHSDLPVKKTVADNGENVAKDDPRKFWQSNPFKYDSSDEDEEDEKANAKEKANSRKSAPYVPLTKKDSFFFTTHDPRFDCINKFFLEADEDFSAVQRNFNEVERAELRSLIKAKIKNTRRKSEKRDVAMKRMIRKLKMKKKQTNKSNKKKFAVKQ